VLLLFHSFFEGWSEFFDRVNFVGLAFVGLAFVGSVFALCSELVCDPNARPFFRIPLSVSDSPTPGGVIALFLT